MNKIIKNIVIGMAIVSCTGIVTELNVSADTITSGEETIGIAYGWNLNNDGRWTCSLDGKTYLKSDWIIDYGIWRYMDEAGFMKTGWSTIQEKRYYFEKNGELKTGWFSDGGKWYYFLESTHVNKDHSDPKDGLLGVMQTGWLRDNDKIYYFNKNGIMQTGWVQDNGKWYYLNQDGSMVVDTTIDGYNIGADGAWIQ